MRLTFALIVVIIVLFALYRKRERFEVTDADYAYVDKLKRIVETVYPPAVDIVVVPGRQSVTVQKKVVYICLKDPKTKQYYPLDVLLYVTLHEIAHVVSKSYSSHAHNGEFKDNFDKLLDAAGAMGYFPTVVSIPKNYCGMR